MKQINETIILDNLRPDGFYNDRVLNTMERNIIVKITSEDKRDIVLKLNISKEIDERQKFFYVCAVYEYTPYDNSKERFSYITDICNYNMEDAIKEAKQMMLSLHGMI